MNALRTVLNELFGLFVDDGSLALTLLLWTLLLGLVVALFTPAPGAAMAVLLVVLFTPAPGAAMAALLVVGYLAALLANVWGADRT